MAVVHPLSMRQQVFAAKIETTTGTDVTPAAADGTVNIFEPSIKHNSPPRDRQGQGSYSPLKIIPGADRAYVSFSFELVGSGASGSATPLAKYFTSSGFSQSSNIFTVASGSATYDTLTCSHYVDGRLFKAVGCMFDLQFSGNRGEPVIVQANGAGRWVAPTSTSLITPTYETTIPPVLEGATFTIGGTAYTIPSFQLSLNNQIYLRESVTATGGYISAYITSRQVKFTCSPESLPFATKDWFATHVAGTTGALVLTIGSSSGNTISMTAPALQLYNPPAIEDREGVQADSLEFISVRSASAGDDDLVCTFT